MTEQEIINKESRIYKLFIEGMITQKEEIKLNIEMMCYKTVTALLTYNYRDYKSAEDVYLFEHSRCGGGSLEQFKSVLGKERIIEIIKEQIEDIDHIEDRKYTDDSFSKACSVVVWKRGEQE